ncbi:flagellar basal body-associated FliL family protein [Oceanobacillus alkalisoli]|uniref:flagellar basal body-associated FliL family protein n=1 Tax=Oceanobacillus alkalisoli TaxID=2925113 RepID=UPI001F11AFED|nr:flagellar basal body-associated FliL family protein [Oceanobacillus alkalisoli]MCF3942425.1 flagellar basal body-associated protein FliL [Oceanobacillus alkalisoli]
MSRLVKVMITSLAILLVGAISVLIVVLNVEGAEEELSIDKVVKYSYETEEIVTDLQDGTFVRIQFRILTDGKEAHEEISLRDFQLVNILIKELALMDEEAFKEGLGDLEATLKDSLNEVMTEGTITDVYTINKILQ